MKKLIRVVVFMKNRNIVFTKLNTAEVVERPMPKVKAGEKLFVR